MRVSVSVTLPPHVPSNVGPIELVTLESEELDELDELEAAAIIVAKS